FAFAEKRRRRHSAAMQAPRFLPNPRATQWLLIVGFLAVGEALYLRYLAIEYAPVSLACQAGLKTWLCTSFRLAIALYNHSVFGYVARSEERRVGKGCRARWA